MACESSLSVREEASGITLPQDIITSILYRLPVKSLCRFRCVSKSWQSLISEPNFIKTHQKTLNRTHLIFDGYNYSWYSVPFSNNEAVSALMNHQPELSKYIFIGSANGLVLASSYDHHKSMPTFVVLNLLAKDSVEVPNYMRHQTRVNEDTLGFGYDSMTDDYKVVSVFNSNVYVYSLRTYAWKQLNDLPYNHSSGLRSRGVFVNGFIHWIARTRKGTSDSITVIVAFSLADETFSEVPSPNGHVLSFHTCRLVVLGDKLAILSKGGLVWLMNEYGVEKSWTKIVVRGYNEFTMIKPENLFATDDVTRIYYLEEQSFLKSGDVSNTTMNLLSLESTFVESLVSPKLDRAN